MTEERWIRATCHLNELSAGEGKKIKSLVYIGNNKEQITFSYNEIGKNKGKE